MNDNGWKIDEHGKRYREIAPGLREYEMTVTVSGGLEIPVSQLDDFHRRQKEADEKRRAAALEEMKNRPPTKYCPFNSSMNNQYAAVPGTLHTDQFSTEQDCQGSNVYQ